MGIDLFGGWIVATTLQTLGKLKTNHEEHVFILHG